MPQDGHLADNQADGVRCGDNGIFKGMPVTEEQKKLSKIAQDIFSVYPFDGKYILDGNRLILCQSKQSNAPKEYLHPNHGGRIAAEGKVVAFDQFEKGE